MNSSVALYTGLIWVAVILYVVATILIASGIMFEKEKLERRSFLPAVAGLLVHSGAIVYWWRIVGHGPYMAPSEVLSSDAWIAMTIFLVFMRIYPKIRQAGILVFPASFLMLALSQFYNPGIRTLPPTFRGIWLVIHIGLYKISLATVLIALAFSLFYLLKRRSSPAPWLLKVPDLPVLDTYAYRFAGFGFIFWTIGMLAGSIWAHQSWGRYWGWDPVETWALITWVLFGINLHLRRFFRMRGVPAAWFFILCFLVSLVSLFVTSHMGTSIHVEYFK
jgi:ABC-type transport system involved in cytochrome c biogenesis permease subunit